MLFNRREDFERLVSLLNKQNDILTDICRELISLKGEIGTVRVEVKSISQETRRGFPQLRKSYIFVGIGAIGFVVLTVWEISSHYVLFLIKTLIEQIIQGGRP